MAQGQGEGPGLESRASVEHMVGGGPGPRVHGWHIRVLLQTCPEVRCSPAPRPGPSEGP